MPDFLPIASAPKDQMIWLYGLCGDQPVGTLGFGDALDQDWFPSESAAMGLSESGWMITHWAEFVAPAS